jgi:hypothetical protein
VVQPVLAVSRPLAETATPGANVERAWPDICMASGEPVWFREPHRTVVRPADLRAHLPRVIRYNGALPWSVLQHLALCVELAEALGFPTPAVPYIAAHDLHEAVVGDLPTHLKQLVPAFRDIEDAWEAHVHRSLGLDWPVPEPVRASVKRVDQIALAVEMACMGHAMAEGVAARRHVVVLPLMREAFAAVAGLTDDARWRVLCRVIPALVGRG